MNVLPPHQGRETTVVYALKRNAKSTKSALETASLLDKKFRMAAAQSKIDCVALPVVEAFDGSEDGPWNDYIQGIGVQVCPYSTAVLGSRGQIMEGSTPHFQDLTTVQKALLSAVQAMSSTRLEKEALSQFVADMKLLETTVLPRKFELFGDDPTLILPAGSFQGPQFLALLSRGAAIDTELGMEQFWGQLAKVYGTSRVARRGAVDPNSGIRESGHRLLFPPTAGGIPTTTGPGSPGWIQVTEQGVKQSFDMTRVMFSRGNISEKIRFGRLVKEGETVLDMYAGIGYYTLPALVHGRAAFVYACEWNEHAVNALRQNIVDNQVQDRVEIVVGDCRATTEQRGLVNMFDRVSLGLLPSSEGGWQTAVRALRDATGGWLHVHGNVPTKEMRSWALWLCHRLRQLCLEENKPSDWIVLCSRVEKVKSFAPTVAHYVADIYIGHPSNHPQSGMMESEKAGVLLGAEFVECPQDIQAPSCALSPTGALSQEWLR